MYGVVKTSFGVWRLSFMSPYLRVGRHIVFAMVVCLSVCLSVTISCPLCNLKTVQDILMELHRTDNVQSARTVTLGYIFLVMPL